MRTRAGRARSRRALLLLSLAALAALLAAACGGGEGSTETATAATTAAATTDAAEANVVSAGAWANSVCTAVNDWQEQVTAGLPSFADVSDVESVKQSLADFLGSVAAATQTMLDEVEAAGVPDIDQGEAIARDFRAALAPLVETFEQARADVESLSADDPSAFVQRLTEIGDSLTQAGNQVASTFTSLARTYPDAGIDAVAADAPACHAITG